MMSYTTVSCFAALGSFLLGECSFLKRKLTGSGFEGEGRSAELRGVEEEEKGKYDIN